MTRSSTFEVRENGYSVWIFWSHGFGNSRVHASFGATVPVLQFEGLPVATGKAVFEALKGLVESEPLFAVISEARRRWSGWPRVEQQFYSYIPLSVNDANEFLSELQEVAA